MKKRIGIIMSLMMAFVLVLLSSCSQSSSTVYNSILSDDNLTTYVKKGVTDYNSYASCKVESANYVALYNNSEVSDAIYYEATIVITEINTTTSTTVEEEVSVIVYFAYFPVASAVYPKEYDYSGEYKTAYTNALAKVNDNTYKGKSGVYNV